MSYFITLNSRTVEVAPSFEDAQTLLHIYAEVFQGRVEAVETASKRVALWIDAVAVMKMQITGMEE